MPRQHQGVGNRPEHVREGAVSLSHRLHRLPLRLFSTLSTRGHLPACGGNEGHGRLRLPLGREKNNESQELRNTVGGTTAKGGGK